MRLNPSRFYSSSCFARSFAMNSSEVCFFARGIKCPSSVVPIRLILAQVMDALEEGGSTMKIKFKRKILANTTISSSSRIRGRVNKLLCDLSARMALRRSWNHLPRKLSPIGEFSSCHAYCLVLFFRRRRIKASEETAKSIRVESKRSLIKE
jgi:hypothetical protein